MSSPVLCRSEAVGSMVDTAIDGDVDDASDSDEPVQLQRITSRCFCQIFYVNYSTEADHESFDKDDVPPVTPVVWKCFLWHVLMCRTGKWLCCIVAPELG